MLSWDDLLLDVDDMKGAGPVQAREDLGITQSGQVVFNARNWIGVLPSDVV